MESPTTGKASPLEAFSGSIKPTRISLLYRLGLVCVAFAMVLLPVIYVGLIALTAWGVLLHIVHDTWIFSGARGGQAAIILFIIYFTPAFAGGTLVFFMVKPFFAPKPKVAESITLDRAQEPVLFGFVDKICGLVGATPPSRIDVDCQVNASARLRDGLFSRDLVLTIGLPLLSGMDMRQFAGIMAHEFGHFAQGAGMRLTYIIRKINFWFARVVYERDDWDLKLERSSRGGDYRIRIVMGVAKGAVWLSRKILWGLMQVGHGISCFMMRQMEYDADSYETKLVGSDVFEATAARIRVLSVASEVAYEDVRQSWTSKRLPENLALLITHKAGALSSDVHQRLAESAAKTKTRWFDTHPCDGDRNKAALRLNEQGVFRLTAPASDLISDFAELSKRVTRHQYEKNFGLKFTDESLMPAEEILRESTANAAAEAVVTKYFKGVNLSFLPVLTVAEIPPPLDIKAAQERWQDHYNKLESLRAEAEKASEEYTAKEERLLDMVGVHELTKLSFKVDPVSHGFPENVNTPGEQETAAKWEIDDIRKSMPALREKLKPFFATLQDLIVIGLQVASQKPGNNEQAANGESIAELVRLLAAVGSEMANAREMAGKARVLTLLAQNAGNHSNPAVVNEAMGMIGCELKKMTSAMQQRFHTFTYPFAHARGRLTVSEYLTGDQMGQNELHNTYLQANAHVDAIFALNYRLIGKVLLTADQAVADLSPAN